MICEGISSIVHSDFYIKSGNGPSIMRNIFENVEYDEYEKQQIEEIKAKMKEKGLQIKLKRSIILKMLMAAQYNIDKAIINCQAHLNFLQEYPKADYTDELRKGPLYVSGFDNQLRPVIVIRQYCDIKIIAYFLETVKRQLLIDYYVENWTVIIDMDTELPILELDDLLYLQLHFYGNLNKILIVNGPEDIDDIVKQFVGIMLLKLEKIKDLQVKIKIITEYQQILQFIPKELLEIKYGGDMSNVEMYWPLIKRESHTGTQKLLKKASHLSINSMGSSLNKKASFMKITVLEENGNPLLNQQVEVFEDQVQSQEQNGEQLQQQQQDEFEEKSKSYQSSTTKKAQLDQQFIQMDDDDLIEIESVERRKGQKQTTRKYGEATKTTSYSQKQTILEGEKEIPPSLSCCSRSCSIF